MPATKSRKAPTPKKPAAKKSLPALKPRRADWPKTGWATLDDAAEFFGVSRRTVERLIQAGRLAKNKLSRNVARIDWEEIWNYRPGA